MGNGQGDTISKQDSIAQGQLDIAKKSQAQSEKTMGIVEPGLITAENYYSSLASGDASKIQAAIAPAASGITSNTEQAKKMITDSTPRGGAQDLALQEADISKAGQIGNLQTQAFTSSFPALASLFSGGAGISVNEISNAIASAQGASQTTAAIGQEKAQGKASTMGFLGSLSSAAGMAAA